MMMGWGRFFGEGWGGAGGGWFYNRAHANERDTKAHTVRQRHSDRARDRERDRLNEKK